MFHGGKETCRAESGDSCICNHGRELFVPSTSVTGQLGLRVVIDYLEE